MHTHQIHPYASIWLKYYDVAWQHSAVHYGDANKNISDAKTPKSSM